MKFLARILPWALLALFLTEVIAVFLIPKRDKDFHFAEFGRLPALMNGRVQPFDSVGHNALLQLRSMGEVPLEVNTNKLGRLEYPSSWRFWRHPKKLKATEWLLEVMVKPEQANQRASFLIHHPELLRTLKLDEIGIEKSGLRYYTYEQLEPHLRQVEELAAQFSAIQDQLRTPYQRQLLKLQQAIVMYQRLQLSLQPLGTEDLAATLDELERSAPEGIAALRAREAGQSFDTNAFMRFVGSANQFVQIANAALPLIVPPRDGGAAKEKWSNFGVAVMDSFHEKSMNPAVLSLANIASAYRKGDVERFNRAVVDYRQWLVERFPTEVKKGRAEFYYNGAKAFLHAMIIYLTSFLLAVATLLTFSVSPTWAASFRRSAVWLVGLAFVVHTFGLIFRMVLEGRPPVTNLYSSAIFIGWGAVILGMVLERFFKVGLGCAVAAFAGFVTLIIAHNLVLAQDSKDTMEMMQAVLDTNFWLATHVTIVTLGYASTFVAGLLGIAYVILGVFTPMLRHKLGAGNTGALDIGKALSKMIYAIVCFATLFSFVGTVLGGIWADQSWGRFWGWDPKENGALIIVLWNALILHARWGGYARERGVAVLSIVGNIVTSYSWFGVNMLGIGLHSYGFMDAAFKWLMLFIVSQLVIIGLGSLPLNVWKSFRARGSDADKGGGSGENPSPAPASV